MGKNSLRTPETVMQPIREEVFGEEPFWDPFPLDPYYKCGRHPDAF